MNYEQALQYIHAVFWKGSRPGLARIRELMHRLGDVQDSLRYIHIVGTNGKGSTAAMLAAVLTRAGYKTGLFTSPYINCFRERMQLDGEMISEAALAAQTEAVRPFAEAMEDKPTEFELITAIALRWFADEGCDIVVLEAGMGGALDATNVIPAPELAVFTNIGLDHTEYLGDTAEAIAATKAGILKPGCAAVCYPNTAPVLAVLAAAAEAQGVPLTAADPQELSPLSHSLEGQSFLYRGEAYALPLLGEHQRKNAAVVLTALELLRARGWQIPPRAVHEGLAAVRWPGRFEILRRRPLFILDGGHNPQCMDALFAAAKTYLQGRELTVLTGVLADKDYHAMYDRTAPLAARFFTITPPNPRALPAEALAAWLGRYGKPVTACASIPEGVAAALAAAGEEGAVLAYGSLYAAGEIRSEVIRKSEEGRVKKE